MEKHGTGIGKICKGLLILSLIFLSSPLYAKALSWSYMYNLRFRQTQDTLFTDNDNSFSVEIENVTPDSVQISVNSLPPNVSFISSKKETVLIKKNTEAGEVYVTGTRIILWMRFTQTGWYKIRPIDLTVDGGFYQIPFEPIEIFENPRFIHPELSVVYSTPEFNSGTPGKTVHQSGCSEKIIFTVKIKYALHINDIYWNIPEDSLFKMVKKIELEKSETGTSFASKPQSIAVFEWQPLKTGRTILPEIFISAVSYGGVQEEIKVPQSLFSIESRPVTKKEEAKTNPYAYAFIDTELRKNSGDDVSTTSQDVLNIIQLRTRERHSLPFISNAARERKAAEQALGLPDNQNEPSATVLVLLLIIIAIILVLLIFLAIIGRRNLSGILTVIFAVGLVTAGIYMAQINQKRAVFSGGEMRAIPEQTISSGVTIPAGSVVFIIKSAGDWSYIKYNESYGWVLTQNVYLIR